MAHTLQASTACFALHMFLIVYSITRTAGAENDVDNRFVCNTKVPFFDTVSMTCDHPLLNISTSSEVKSIFWIFPDGTNVHSEANVDRNLYTFSSQSIESYSPGQEPGAVLDLYNLTALEIDEDQFGYYHCVVTYKSASRPATVIRWGLNVNGADFSDLLREYRRKAVIGGIAAACLLLLVGGCCLFWNVRNSKRDQEMEKENGDLNDLKTDIEVSPSAQGDNEKKFHNAAYESDVGEQAAIDVHM